MRAGLDKNIILETAGKIADTKGISSLTLKALAEELGVKSPSLYKHISGLDELNKELMLYGWKSLEKEINNQQKTINDMIRDKERDNATSKADDMIEAIEKDLEARIEAMDKEMQEETLLGNVKSGMTTLEEIMNNIGLASNSVNMNMLMVGDSINSWNTSLDTFVAKMNSIQGANMNMSINGGINGVGSAPTITINTTLNMEGVDLANEENLRRLLDENAEENQHPIIDNIENQ